MYILLVNDDNTLTTASKERIVQRSKLCDNIQILIPVDYKGFDMQDFEVTMVYTLPKSGEKYSRTLTKEAELYEYICTCMVFIVPADTWLTKEGGDVAVELSMTKVEMGEDNIPIQYVRKITDGIIHIASSDDWGSGIADGLLQGVDQRIIQLQMIAKQMEEANQTLSNTKADDIRLTNDNRLTLTANGQEIGSKILVGVPNIDESEVDDVIDGIIEI